MERRREILLVLRAQAGDRGAFEELLAAARGGLFAYLRGLIGDADRAEDVLQDVFVKVYRKLVWLREPGLFQPWVRRIATREAMRELRARGRERDALALAGEETREAEEEARAPDEELLHQLPRLVQGVSPKSRAVLLLHYFEQRSLEEVAAIVGAPLGTVKSRLSYGLRALRQTLETDHEFRTERPG